MASTNIFDVNVNNFDDAKQLLKTFIKEQNEENIRQVIENRKQGK